MKKISIITPCFNSEKYIQETIESIINQTAILSQRAELEYIICDGNSSDRTLLIIESMVNKYINPSNIKLISESDSGVYSALAKGLKLATGDIIAYLNAGDYYHKCAFDVVLDVFETKNINWLTGYKVAYNEKSHFISAVLPYNYRKRFFDCGFYIKQLRCVQQESTFWNSKLNTLIDYDILAKFKYAGDYYLWSQFAKIENLYIIEAYLGGFKHHTGQISEDLESYYEEVKSICVTPRIDSWVLAYIDKFIWHTSARVKKTLNPQTLFRYDHLRQLWK
jgi:glycosyltransferase involved in cell wall biosynthesis